MQLLFDESEENGPTHGLSLIPGKVVRFAGTDENGFTYKVPHMGWNRLDFHQASPLLEGLEEDYVYFVHSYYVDTDSRFVTASADYHLAVPAIVGTWKCVWHAISPRKKWTNGYVTAEKLFVISRKKGGHLKHERIQDLSGNRYARW